MKEHVRTKQVITDFKEMIDPETGELMNMPVANTFLNT